MEPQERSHPPIALETDFATALRFVTAIAALVRMPGPATADPALRNLDRRSPVKPAFDDRGPEPGDAP
jgi:hypothetical protein